jgi:hypothetical protein
MAQSTGTIDDGKKVGGSNSTPSASSAAQFLNSHSTSSGQGPSTSSGQGVDPSKGGSVPTAETLADLEKAVPGLGRRLGNGLTAVEPQSPGSIKVKPGALDQKGSDVKPAPGTIKLKSPLPISETKPEQSTPTTSTRALDALNKKTSGTALDAAKARYDIGVVAPSPREESGEKKDGKTPTEPKDDLPKTSTGALRELDRLVEDQFGNSALQAAEDQIPGRRKRRRLVSRDVSVPSISSSTSTSSSSSGSTGGGGGSRPSARSSGFGGSSGRVGGGFSAPAIGGGAVSSGGMSQPGAAPSAPASPPTIQDPVPPSPELPPQLPSTTAGGSPSIPQLPSVPDLAKGARGIGKGFNLAKGAGNFLKGFGGLGGLFGGTGAAAGGSTAAAGAVATAPAWGTILFWALIVVLVIIIFFALIAVISSIAAPNQVITQANTVGKLESFVEVFNTTPQDAKQLINGVGDPIVIEKTTDAAGNSAIKSIRVKQNLKLRPVNEYNRRFLNGNDGFYVEVTDIKLRYRLNLPGQFTDSNGNSVTVTHPEQVNYFLGYGNGYANNIPTFDIANQDSISWQPIICGEKSTGSGLLQTDGNNVRACRPGQLEEAYVVIVFETPIPICSFSNCRVELSEQAILNYNLFKRSNTFGGAGELVGPGIVDNPESINQYCISPQTSKIINCSDTNNAAEAIEAGSGSLTGPPRGTGAQPGDGCPAGLVAGDILDCTNPFKKEFNPRLSHLGVDYNVKNNGNIQADRKVFSPINGRVTYVNSIPEQNKCGVGIVISEADAQGNLIQGGRSFYIGHISGLTFGKDALVTSGADLGTYFNPGGGTRYFPGFEPRQNPEYPEGKVCWTAPHIHFEYRPNGTSVDPQEFIRNSCKVAFQCGG